MLYVGCHLSISKGFYAIGKDAESIGANVFQYFSRNPRGGSAKPLDIPDIKKYLEFAKEQEFGTALCHAPYTLNACAANEGLREFARITMADDLDRLENIPGSLYNFHPGSHVKQGTEVGISYIADMLNDIIKPDMHTTILLETMSGKGSEVGRTFEELREIIDRVESSDKLGVCLDTCHIWDGGYDIAGDLDGVISKFDSIIGLERLKAIHLNDSMNELGAHKDRHAKLGEGKIGFDALARVINHDKLKQLPFYLETPNDLEGYSKEIAMLKEVYIE